MTRREACEANRPLMAITMGDPAGVGPELCLRVMADARMLRHCVPVVFADAALLERVARICRLPFSASRVSLREWRRLSGNRHGTAGGEPLLRECTVVDGGAVGRREVRPGRVDARCGRAAYGYIEAAISSALEGSVAAIVTAPINKESLHLAGVPHPGHTEILTELTGARRVCMTLAADELVVSLVTAHVALADVPARVTKQRIGDVIALTHDAMRRLGTKSPRIVVCGLNPHAGEHGVLGNAEQKTIAPAVKVARAKGYAVTGPMPPDTAFLPEKRRVTDAYVAMYHDQGLIPFKMLAFEKGVNITLGLPIVRTSPDHGTAFDIAWQGKASPGSMFEAVHWAARLAGRDRASKRR